MAFCTSTERYKGLWEVPLYELQVGLRGRVGGSSGMVRVDGSQERWDACPGCYQPHPAHPNSLSGCAPSERVWMETLPSQGDYQIACPPPSFLCLQDVDGTGQYLGNADYGLDAPVDFDVYTVGVGRLGGYVVQVTQGHAFL